VGCEADLYRLGEGYVGWKRHGNFYTHALGQRTIKKEKDTRRAYVLGLGGRLIIALTSYPDRRRQMHFKTPHGATILPGLLCGTFSWQTHEPRPSQISPQMQAAPQLWKPPTRQIYLFTNSLQVQTSPGTDSVNAS
jgi:hypothetical protein